MSNKHAGSLGWVLAPALLTLGITLVRLLGELEGWDPTWFGVEAGGASAPATPDNPSPPSLFGIFWLMPLLGIYFAYRLLREGDVARHRGKALLFSLIGLGLFAGAFMGLITLVKDQGRTPLFLYGQAGLSVIAWVAALIAGKGWPSLFRLTLLYAVLARLPIVVIAFILCPQDKGTHYEKLAPFAPDDLAPMTKAFWLSLAQVGTWIPLTIILGGLFGALTSFVVPRKSR